MPVQQHFKFLELKGIKQLSMLSSAVQSTLGFETLDKVAALGLETATPLTDPVST